MESNHVGMSQCDIGGVYAVAGVPGEGKCATCREVKVAKPELWPSSPCPALISRPSWLPLAGTFTNVSHCGLSTAPWADTAYVLLLQIWNPSWGLRGLATGRQPGPAPVLGPPPDPRHTHTQLVLCPCPETSAQGRNGDFRKSSITSSCLLPPELSEHSPLMSLGMRVGHQQGFRTTDPRALSFPALSPRFSHPICYLHSIP